MQSILSSILLAALVAPSAIVAFQFSSSSSVSSSSSATALRNALRDMAAYPDDNKMMSEFEAFDRNGAFSRSPMMQGAGGQMLQGQGGMMGGPFAHRQQPPQMGRGGGGGRGRSLDGFAPHSAYGNSYGMSQSENRRGDVMMMREHGGMGGGGMDYGMDYFGPPPPDMMMMMSEQQRGGGRRGGGGGGGPRNPVRNDNTMGGFSYSSRVTDYAGYDRGMGGGFEGGPMMMGDRGGFDGPMMMGGGEMDYEMFDQQQQQQEQRGGGGGGYGGFGDMSRMGP